MSQEILVQREYSVGKGYQPGNVQVFFEAVLRFFDSASEPVVHSIAECAFDLRTDLGVQVSPIQKREADFLAGVKEFVKKAREDVSLARVPALRVPRAKKLLMAFLTRMNAEPNADIADQFARYTEANLKEAPAPESSPSVPAKSEPVVSRKTTPVAAAVQATPRAPAGVTSEFEHGSRTIRFTTGNQIQVKLTQDLLAAVLQFVDPALTGNPRKKLTAQIVDLALHHRVDVNVKTSPLEEKEQKVLALIRASIQAANSTSDLYEFMPIQYQLKKVFLANALERVDLEDSNPENLKAFVYDGWQKAVGEVAGKHSRLAPETARQVMERGQRALGTSLKLAGVAPA